VNIGLILVLAGLGWILVAIVVALAVGAMATARDADARPAFDHPLAAGQFGPHARDEGVRTAV